MTKYLQKKIIVISIIIIFLSISFIPASGFNKILKKDIIKNVSLRTWIVDDEGDGDFTRIQDALNAANSGDIVKVYSGLYTEQLVINVDNIFVEAVEFELGSGQDFGKPIIDGNNIGDVIYIISDGIEINGFFIQNSGNENNGIYIHSTDNIITENHIINNHKGIYIYDSTDNTIFNNNFSENDEGIYLDKSFSNTIEGNNIIGNIIGIFQMESEKNIITNNQIKDNEDGIFHYFSHSNDIFDNEFGNNINGIYLTYGSNNNNIKENIATGNTNGVNIVGSSTNKISNNDISKNIIGINLYSSSYNIVNQNTIYRNEKGIKHIGFKNTISENIISENYDVGIYFNRVSHNSSIINNNISSVTFTDSILFHYSCDNNIINNHISGAGMAFYNSKKNNISHNSISKPFNGLYFNNSCNNLIFNNTISLCNFDAVYLCKFSGNNKLHHNHFINNHQNAYDLSENIWDNGYPSGGNHWSDFDEPIDGAFDQYSGPNQDEIHSDGIVDTPYHISGANNTDNYPIMIFWGPPTKPEQPTGVTNGRTGRNYKYSTVTTDPEGDKIQYGWDWDGDKLVDDWTQFFDSGIEITTYHTWETEGSYEISVRAIDEFGTLSEWSDPLHVTMPKQRLIKSFLMDIFENTRFFMFLQNIYSNHSI